MASPGLHEPAVRANDLVIAAEYPTRAHADQAAARLMCERIWATVDEPEDSTDRGGDAWPRVAVQEGDLYTARIMLDLMHEVDAGRSRIVPRMPRSWWSTSWLGRIGALLCLIVMVTPATILVLLALDLIEAKF